LLLSLPIWVVPPAEARNHIPRIELSVLATRSRSALLGRWSTHASQSGMLYCIKELSLGCRTQRYDYAKLAAIGWGARMSRLNKEGTHAVHLVGMYQANVFFVAWDLGRGLCKMPIARS
jgi:hypothetical protein